MARRRKRGIEQVRAAVADALEARGHGNREFIRQVREGAQDDGPYMIGAIAEWAAADDGVSGGNAQRRSDDG